MYLHLLGKKIGSTKIYSDNAAVHVTVVKIENNVVLGKRTVEKNGYNALIVGGLVAKESRVNKPQLESFKKSGIEVFPSYIEECRMSCESDIEVGHKFDLSESMIGATVDTVSVSKGKGFAGCMKRHNFAGMPASHGVSVTHRHGGSTGNRSLPGKVFKGKKMAGRMGGDVCTQQNLKIVGIDKDLGCVFIKGSISGAENSFVLIKSAIKKYGTCNQTRINE